MKHKYRKYRLCFDFANLALLAEINCVKVSQCKILTVMCCLHSLCCVTCTLWVSTNKRLPISSVHKGLKIFDTQTKNDPHKGGLEKQRLEGLPFVSCTNGKIALICVFKYETHIAAADCS